MHKPLISVVVLGGYGNFGTIVARRIATLPNVALIVAGRDETRARTMAATLDGRGMALDGNGAGFAAALRKLDATIVINCAGPFQGAEYNVARGAIAAGAHYVDIADGRRFVCDIAELDGPARRAGVAVISGASSVPALSSAVVEANLHRFAELTAVDTGISASEKIPGEATVAAVLSYIGRPIDVTRNGVPDSVFGWQGLRRESFSAPAGRRWQGFCDVPDLELFPAYYRQLRNVAFSAGLGLSTTHLGTWLLAGLVRCGLVRRPERLARPLRRIALQLERFGDGVSAMYVRMTGIDDEGMPVAWRWELLARNNEGAQIPCLAAAALCRKFADGEELEPGARPCLGVLSLDEYLDELQGLAINVVLQKDEAD